MNENTLTFEVTVRMSKLDKGPVAFASVFCPEKGINIEGVKIWDNEKGCNMQLPGYSKTVGDKKYYNTYVRFDSFEENSALRKAVLDAYSQVSKSVKAAA